ncbi:MAG: hypothetical protein IKA48_00105 [Fibrobacter sp.]|nr:hypothetical protein [Fibrobacter sp.]
MKLNIEYLGGLLCEDWLMVKSGNDRPDSEFYSYLFTHTTEFAETGTHVLVHHPKRNTEGTGIDKEYQYVLTVSDMDGANMRYVGAKRLSSNHYRYIGDNVFAVADEKTWLKEGYDG